MSGKQASAPQTPAAKGNEASRHLKAEAKKQEKKVEAKTGHDLKKGASRVEERSRSSDGKSAGIKQK